MLESITISKLKEMIGSIKIIDIRDRNHFNNNHIPGAINLEGNTLITSPNKYLNYNEKYYIYCQKGITSIKICTQLRKLGYKVINIQGGYEEWVLES